MNKAFVSVVGLILITTIIGCGTVSGAVRDVADTARNIRDIISVGKDIDDM